jgi:hypothetical protein
MKTYQNADVLKLTGCAENQLTVWLAGGAIVPHDAASSRGERHLFDFRNLVEVAICAALAEHGNLIRVMARFVGTLRRADGQPWAFPEGTTEPTFEPGVIAAWERFRNPETRGADDFVGLAATFNGVYLITSVAGVRHEPTILVVGLRSILENLEGLTGDRWPA